MLLTESKNKLGQFHTEEKYEYYTDKLDNCITLKIIKSIDGPKPYIDYIVHRNDERDFSVNKEFFDTLKEFLDAEVELTLD